MGTWTAQTPLDRRPLRRSRRTPDRGGSIAIRSCRMRRGVAVAVLVGSLMAAGCGGHGSSSTKMVWCVAPGEQVTPELKRDYPELYMSKAACDAVNG